MTRHKLIIDLLKIADETNYNDETSPIIADMFINKYTGGNYIANPLCNIIVGRFQAILNEAAYWRKCERQSLNKLI